MRGQCNDDAGDLADAKHQEQDDSEDGEKRSNEEMQEDNASGSDSRILRVALDGDTGSLHAHNISDLCNTRKCNSDLNN